MLSLQTRQALSTRTVAGLKIAGKLPSAVRLALGLPLHYDRHHTTAAIMKCCYIPRMIVDLDIEGLLCETTNTLLDFS